MKKMTIVWALFLAITNLFFVSSNCLTLQRVILSTDDNPEYIQFWPIVAKTWKEIVGLKPTLALIASADVQVDETLGDVIRFEPIEGISTALQAQLIRLLLPAYFPEEGCIISDIDMIPLSKDYFIDSVKDASDDSFVVYRDGAYLGKRFPMCYNAAKGKVFQKVFCINSIEEISQKISKWNELQLGWNTDEILLFLYLNHWDKYTTNCLRLGHRVLRHQRIDRIDWKYDTLLLKKGFYIDAHCPRPYQQYSSDIDLIVQSALAQIEEY